MRALSRVGLATIAAAIAAWPAEASHVPRTGQRVGGWDVARVPGNDCLVRREFGKDTLVSFTQSDGRGMIAISSATFDSADTEPYRMSLLVDGERRPFAGESIPGTNGLTMAFESSFVPILSAASVLDVHGFDGVLVKRVYLGDLKAALAGLPACFARAGDPVFSVGSLAPPPPPPMPSRGKQRLARAQANLASLFSSDDYPKAARQAGEEGAVAFRLHVDKAGRVATCSVTVPSGSESLDGATCSLLTERARFTPALDRKGRPTEDDVSGRIIWQNPEPYPEPEPPTPP